MMSGQMSNQILHGLEVHGTETAAVSALRVRAVLCRYDVSMDGTEMLKQMCLLLEHSNAQATGERFFAGMNT